MPQGDFPTAWHGGYGNAASARRLSPRRSQSPRPHTPSSQSGPSQPAGYSGYRSKEGYTGYRPEQGTSNIRTSNDQNRSSEGLRSMWQPSPWTPRSSMNSGASSSISHAEYFRESPRRSSSPQQRRSSSTVGRPPPRYVPPPAHYEHVPYLEGYTGHRPNTHYRGDNLGSGKHNFMHSPPRVGYPGQLLNSTHRVAAMSQTVPMSRDRGLQT